MSVLPIIAARKSEDTINVVDGSSLTFYPITEWDIRVIVILWVLFFITSIFCVLRLYSRIKILEFYALEDYLYNFAFTLLLAYNAIITYYSYHGLGSQLLDVMTTADVKLAVVFENVLFDLASLGLLIAKASLIAFLMRLVPQHHSPGRWRVLIIGPLVALAIVSIGSIMAMWSRCFSELAGDTLLCSSIAPATRWMQAAAGVSVAVDLWYAALPWYLLRRLSRPRREKVLIQGSMSLGVIAAGCGIARALSIYPAVTNMDAESAAVLYLWHGAEMAVTMICIGMPVCRPAVSSMLSALGYKAQLKESTTSNRATASYIRNFSAGTWEDAVGAHDIDSWSQRRILGVGGATSGVVGGKKGGSGGSGGRGSGSGSGSGSGGFVKELKGESYEVDDGFPMSTMNKTGITVTKTVAVTNGRQDSV